MVASDSAPRHVVDVATVRKRVADDPAAAFAIQHDRLYELLTYGDGLPEAHKRLGAGSWNQGHDVLRAVLTYLAQRAFGIHRLPWHHDRSCDEIARDGHSDHDALALLRDAAQVNAMCAEVRALRAHTHALLNSMGATHVRLRRGLVDLERTKNAAYATRVATMAEIANSLGWPRFNLPVDVLSSWGGGGYSHYPVVIEHDVPIAALLCFSDGLANRVPSRGHSLEEDEWVVLNTAVDGVLSLATNCLAKCDLTLPPMSHWSKKTLRAELAQLARVYGTASSMYCDYYPIALGRDGWWSRLRRAWKVLRAAPL